MSIEDPAALSTARLVIGLDGGNSKTHLVLATAAGDVLAAVAGPSMSPPVVGLPRSAEVFAELIAESASRAGLKTNGPAAEVAVVCLAGADTAAETRQIQRTLAQVGGARRLLVNNDAAAALRAGAPRGWGVALVCGTGINALGRAPDGRMAGFPALGALSGDWGGGMAVGVAALAAAVRGRDGRGPHTSLEVAIPAAFGRSTPLAVTMAIHRGRLAHVRLRELAPVVYDAARHGDAVAGALLDRLADELASMAISVIRRLHLVRRDVDVVLAGGLLAGGEPRIIERTAAAIRAVARDARVRVLADPPVIGAVLMALDLLDDGPAAAGEQRLRRQHVDPR
ncbi:MAG: BadF/BadG/BcrA/BcrD ATPase family protein [Chloroflexota bacterium]